MTDQKLPPIRTSLDPQGNTMVYLTDGSTVGMEGDQSEAVAGAITDGASIMFGQPSATVVINSAHIVSAFHIKEQNQ